jgi:hypothetical protein
MDLDNKAVTDRITINILVATIDQLRSVVEGLAQTIDNESLVADNSADLSRFLSYISSDVGEAMEVVQGIKPLCDRLRGV